MTQISSALLPLLVVLTSLLFLLKKETAVDAFMRGAGDGFRTSLKLLPTLILLMVAVGMFSASGLGDALSRLLSRVFFFLPIPEKLYPLFIVRPFSGSAGTALLSDLFEKEGADSRVGIAASILAGCSDTVFYVTAVYFAAADVKKTRHTIPVALTVSLLLLFLSSAVAAWLVS